MFPLAVILPPVMSPLELMLESAWMPPVDVMLPAVTLEAWEVPAGLVTELWLVTVFANRSFWILTPPFAAAGVSPTVSDENCAAGAVTGILPAPPLTTDQAGAAPLSAAAR